MGQRTITYKGRSTKQKQILYWGKNRFPSNDVKEEAGGPLGIFQFGAL